MISRKKCPVCDSEELADAVAVAGGDELVCAGCASSYESLMAEIRGRSEPDAASVAPEVLRAEAAAEDVYAVRVNLHRIPVAGLALAAALSVGAMLLAGWAGPSAKSAETVLSGYAQEQDASDSRGDLAATEIADARTPAVAPQSSAKIAEEVTAEELTPAEDEATAQADAATEQPAEVAAPPVESAPEAASETRVEEGGYTVQVSSHGNDADAKARANVLRAKGLDARVAAAQIAGKGTWYRVQSGRFQTREEAAAYAKKLQASGVVPSTFVTQVQN